MTPQRVQRKRTKGWRMPENTVYVGRPTYWGNDFSVGTACVINAGIDDEQFVVQSPQQAVRLFENWQLPQMRLRAGLLLRGKNLACWCPVDQPCHADALLKAANA